MAQRNMPGTTKQRSVSRPAQGRGKRAVSFDNIGRHGKQKLATPKFASAKSRSGSLDVS